MGSCSPSHFSFYPFPPGLWHSPQNSPTQKANKQEGAEEGYPSHSCTLVIPTGGFRGLGGTAHQNFQSSVSSRKAGDQKEKRKGGELNQKINPGTKAWRLGSEGRNAWVRTHKWVDSGSSPNVQETQTFLSYVHTLCANRCPCSEIVSHPLLVLT